MRENKTTKDSSVSFGTTLRQRVVMLNEVLVSLCLIIPLLNAQITYNCKAMAACGCSSRPAALSRMFGAESAVTDSWGWAASILINQTYYCGAVLISSSWVLTTTSCVQGYRAFEIWVSAGTNVFLERKQARTASRIIQHPSFDVYWWTNDIALAIVTWEPSNDSFSSFTLLQQVTLQRVESNATACSSTIRNSSIQLCARSVDGMKGDCRRSVF